MELSIIVPIYNVEDYLEECLKSLYNIKNIKLEIILVNDGSKDNSFKIMEKFKEIYPEKTVLINKENGGLSSARNAGMKAAVGEYISFIDSDDFIDVDEFEKFFKEGQKDKLDVMVGNMRYYTPEKTGDSLFRSDIIKNSGIVNGIDFFWNLFQKPKCFREEVVDDIYKREFLVKNNIWFNENIVHEDSEFTPLVYLKAEKVKYIDRAFYFYRQRTGSIMNKVSEKSIVSLESICEKFFIECKNLDSKKGKEVLSSLILSFYSVVVYKRYNGAGDWKRVHKRYKELYRELKNNKGFELEEFLLSFSVFIPNMLRKFLGKQITNVQKIPKF
ncbi:glycosyltransferase [Fusobacterium varium]|uniref:glycosyltransferase n=1 Tax=Fusobacterium varium TaxID=856 RepID=UPI000E416B89|nr:glycosyltransferase [Fusobacterium varium]MCI6031246.1 glycosyltransferase [Fusobacterium varium]RGJ23743.1 glycosyltransferase [Fusobacterium varium]